MAIPQFSGCLVNQILSISMKLGLLAKPVALWNNLDGLFCLFNSSFWLQRH